MFLSYSNQKLVDTEFETQFRSYGRNWNHWDDIVDAYRERNMPVERNLFLAMQYYAAYSGLTMAFIYDAIPTRHKLMIEKYMVLV